MEDLLPAGVADALRTRLGPEFDEMSPAQRITLSAAAVENAVTHARAMSLCDMHPGDMTKLLQGLVQQGCLTKAGHGRGTRCHLPDAPPRTGETFADGRHPLLSALPSSPDLGVRSPDLGVQGAGRISSTDRASTEAWRTHQSPISSLDDLDHVLRSELISISQAIEGGRVARKRVEGVIALLCDGRYLTLRVLSQLLGRSEDHTRKRYINPLVRSGDLLLAFPQAPNDPRQAYTAFRFSSDDDRAPDGAAAERRRK